MIVDPTRAIGRSIVTTGLFDLAVSELLARLIDPGDIVVDAGANVGYMTVLAATAAGRSGRVLAFEPHPELFAVLCQNAGYAMELGYHVTLVCDATAAFSRDMMRAAHELNGPTYAHSILTTLELVAAIGQRQPATAQF